MSDKRKALWPWIVALLIGLPVLYVASFGPAFSVWWSAAAADNQQWHSLVLFAPEGIRE
jgi:hypothetical protein